MGLSQRLMLRSAACMIRSLTGGMFLNVSGKPCAHAHTSVRRIKVNLANARGGGGGGGGK